MEFPQSSSEEDIPEIHDDADFRGRSPTQKSVSRTLPGKNKAGEESQDEWDKLGHENVGTEEKEEESKGKGKGKKRRKKKR